MQCPTCGARLAVDPIYSEILGIIGGPLSAFAFVILSAEIVEVAHHSFNGIEVALGILTYVLLSVMWQIRIVPKFSRLRVADEKEELSYPLASEMAEMRDKLERERYLRRNQQLLEKIAEARRTGQPEPKIPRNGPCTCGSGKKFKKCCGNVMT